MKINQMQNQQHNIPATAVADTKLTTRTIGVGKTENKEPKVKTNYSESEFRKRLRNGELQTGDYYITDEGKYVVYFAAYIREDGTRMNAVTHTYDDKPDFAKD